MVDVLDQIKPQLQFRNEDDFYFLQILQRKKENPQLGSNSRVIKNYYIGSVEYLESRYDEIKDLCKMFNARAMLRLNRRSYRKVSFENLKLVTEHVYSSNHNFIKKSYDRCCGRYHSEPRDSVNWIIDVDGDMPAEEEVILKKSIFEYEPKGEKVILQLPTKNGFHLITRPFRLDLFKARNVHDVHRDNPINLFIP